MKNKYNVCVIGTGHIANKFHIPSFKKSKKINKIILVDKNNDNLVNTARKFKIKSIYPTLKDAIKKEKINFVNICTPPSTHRYFINEAIKNKLHLFVEKPFVLKHKNFVEIFEKIKKYKLKCQCAYHQRFRPISREIKKILKKKEIGKVYYIKIINRKFRGIPKHSKYFSSKKYSGGGPLIDLGSHYFDLVGWLLNFPKISKFSNYMFDNIFAQKKEKKYLPFKKFDNEELAVGNIKFKNGCLLNFELSYVLNTNKEFSKIEIFGTKGYISWPDGVQILIKKNKKMFKKIKFKKFLASNRQVENFIDCLPKKFSFENLKHIGFTVNLIQKLYDFK